MTVRGWLSAVCDGWAGQQIAAHMCGHTLVVSFTTA